MFVFIRTLFDIVIISKFTLNLSFDRFVTGKTDELFF